MSRGTAQGDKLEGGDVGHDSVDVKFIGHRSHSKLDNLLCALPAAVCQATAFGADGTHQTARVWTSTDRPAWQMGGFLISMTRHSWPCFRCRTNPRSSSLSAFTAVMLSCHWFVLKIASTFTISVMHLPICASSRFKLLA